jgi:hypothetical protein
MRSTAPSPRHLRAAPSSSTISTAPRLGIAGCDRASAASIVERVHHLDRGGQDPAAIDAETAAPAASVESNAASSVRTASGRADAHVIRTAIPSVPSEPTNAPSRSGPASSRESVTSSPSAGRRRRRGRG